jgi:phosphoenolpyruvate-protein kinase (PTS system EI component)
MLEMFKLAVLGAKRNGRHIGICGEAPANYPEIARFLAQIGIDAISVNPSSILRTMQAICDAEKRVDHSQGAAIVAARRPNELLYRLRYVRQPAACLCVAYRLHRSQNA